MGEFHKKVHEVSQDLVQLLEDMIDDGSAGPLYPDIISDHRAILQGISNVSIISNVYTRTYRFLQEQVDIFKEKSSFTNAVLCKVVAQRVRDVIVSSLKETQPIEIQYPDEEDS